MLQLIAQITFPTLMLIWVVGNVSRYYKRKRRDVPLGVRIDNFIVKHDWAEHMDEEVQKFLQGNPDTPWYPDNPKRSFDEQTEHWEKELERIKDLASDLHDKSNTAQMKLMIAKTHRSSLIQMYNIAKCHIEDDSAMNLLLEMEDRMRQRGTIEPPIGMRGYEKDRVEKSLTRQPLNIEGKLYG